MANNLLNTIRSGMYTFLLTGTNSLKTLITQVVSSTSYYKLYYSEVPQYIPGSQTEVSLPYVVMDLLPIETDRDSESKFYNFTIQFRLGASTIDNLEALVQALIDLLEDSEGTLTFPNGYTLIAINKEPIVSLGKIDNVWNCIVPYLITLQQ